MTTPGTKLTDSEPFQWHPETAGAEWIACHLTRFRNTSPLLNEFARALNVQASGRLLDWIDHLQVSSLLGVQESGFEHVGDNWYLHPGALLPPVRFGDSDQIYLKVDSVADFVGANRWKFSFDVVGKPLDVLRTATTRLTTGVTFGVIERHGCHPVQQTPAVTMADEHRLAILDVDEMFLDRRRDYQDLETGFAETRLLVESAIASVGRDRACDAFFRAERKYWQSRNQAGQIQYMRQQSLGLGWGNHDHHTYRSSRSCFHRLIELFELLGFTCRERFYAGAQAGWGAQVLEHPVCNVVIFADVDLDPAEITGDIAHEPLPSRETVGTIGLWCALHGEAVLQAGMHHLECQFDFDLARDHLASSGIGCMKPFTDFPHLRQCFTEGEKWVVDPGRLRHAVGKCWITQEQAERFQAEGVVGSHLEVLERNDGYRGFNQTGINEIIRKTDPRSLNASASD